MARRPVAVRPISRPYVSRTAASVAPAPPAPPAPIGVHDVIASLGTLLQQIAAVTRPVAAVSQPAKSTGTYQKQLLDSLRQHAVTTAHPIPTPAGTSVSTATNTSATPAPNPQTPTDWWAPGYTNIAPDGTPFAVYYNRILAGGSLNWRYHNPGNLQGGAFATSMGAIGTDSSGFAVFPDFSSGFSALYCAVKLPFYDSMNLGQVLSIFGVPWDPASSATKFLITNGFTASTPMNQIPSVNQSQVGFGDSIAVAHAIRIGLSSQGLGQTYTISTPNIPDWAKRTLQMQFLSMIFYTHQDRIKNAFSSMQASILQTAQSGGTLVPSLTQLLSQAESDLDTAILAADQQLRAAIANLQPGTGTTTSTATVAGTNTATGTQTAAVKAAALKGAASGGGGGGSDEEGWISDANQACQDAYARLKEDIAQIQSNLQNWIDLNPNATTDEIQAQVSAAFDAIQQATADAAKDCAAAADAAQSGSDTSQDNPGAPLDTDAPSAPTVPVASGDPGVGGFPGDPGAPDDIGTDDDPEDDDDDDDDDDEDGV
ncbi:MAG: hypothetical protein ABSG62_18795 [Terracidiphilus sp.]